LQNCKRLYLTGLAKMALRFHDSFRDEWGGRQVSMIPNSSDYLARRLQMLRSNDRSPGKSTTRTLSWCGMLLIVQIAVVTTLIRSSTLRAENAQEEAPKVASLPKERGEKVAKADEKTGEVEPLFARKPFDLSFLQHAEEGAALIRVGELLRHPEIA